MISVPIIELVLFSEIMTFAMNDETSGKFFVITGIETFSVGTILCAAMLHVVFGSPHSFTPTERLRPVQQWGHGGYMAGIWDL